MRGRLLGDPTPGKPLPHRTCSSETASLLSGGHGLDLHSDPLRLRRVRPGCSFWAVQATTSLHPKKTHDRSW